MGKKHRAEDAIARSCIAVRVRMLNRVVTNLYDEALRPLGIKVSQLNILVVAAKYGTAKPADVCEVLILDTSTLSRNVLRMVAKGWLEIVPGEDKRTQPFRVTDDGRRLMEKAMKLWGQAQERATAMLGEDGVRLLNDIERRLVQTTVGG